MCDTLRKYFSSHEARYQNELPIYAARERIVSTLQTHRVIVITGDTGCGKSTQLPLMCVEAGLGKKGALAITQPRRIAASSLAQRLCTQVGVPLGSDIGYKTRFSRKISRQSNIVFMTDGMLLSEIHRDQLLRRYDTIIIDEAHERNLNIDIILGVVKRACIKRPDLRVVVSSATINAELFSTFFNSCPVLHVEGVRYPVDLWYAPNERNTKEDAVDSDYVEAAVQAVDDIVTTTTQGDLLVFMPTTRDVHETIARIEKRRYPHTQPLPLYSRLPAGRQNAIFSAGDMRRIVVATNIAETSLTVPGIRYVVDTGLARIKRYSPNSRITGLRIEPVSQASADQRKGRCGRVGPGSCIRLYSENEYLTRPEYTPAEIVRCDLAGAILTVEYAGLGPIEQFDFVQQPRSRRISDGYSLLRELGAIATDNRLTPRGKKMATIPLDPRLAGMILMARTYNVSYEVAIIAAALSMQDPLDVSGEKGKKKGALRKRFGDERSDFMVYVNLFTAFLKVYGNKKSTSAARRFCKEYTLSWHRMQQWHDLYTRIMHMSSRSEARHGSGAKPNFASYENIHKCIIAGFVSNCACRDRRGYYRAAKGRKLYVHPGSCVKRNTFEWLICHEIVETSRVFARKAGKIEPEWVQEVAPHLCRSRLFDPGFSPQTGDVRVRERITVFGLTLSEKAFLYYGNRNPEEAFEIFIREGLVREGLVNGDTAYTFDFLHHNSRVRQRATRIRAKLRIAEPDDEEERICAFYRERLPVLASVRELRRHIQQRKGQKHLYLPLENLVSRQLLRQATHYPDELTIGHTKLALDYTYAPQSEEDGISVTVTEKEKSYVDRKMLSWVVPAMWQDKVFHLLSSLPKRIRRELVPVSETAVKVTRALELDIRKEFIVAVCDTVWDVCGIRIEPKDIRQDKIPGYLQMRVAHQRHANEGEPAGTAWSEAAVAAAKNEACFSQWGMRNCREWRFGTIAEYVELAKDNNGIPLIGYPCIQARDAHAESVDLVVKSDRDQAEYTHREGVASLKKIVLARDLAWLEKDLRFDHALKLACMGVWNVSQIQTRLHGLIMQDLFYSEMQVRTKERFESECAETSRACKTIGREVISLIHKSATMYRECSQRIERMAQKRTGDVHAKNAGQLRSWLTGYRDALYDPWMSLGKLRQYPRYLKAMDAAVHCAFDDTRKFRLKSEALKTSLQRREDACSRFSYWMERNNGEKMRRIQEFDLMVQEHFISLFAQQQVKTLYSVTEKKLAKHYACCCDGKKQKSLQQKRR